MKNLIFVELNELNFNYVKKYFDKIKINSLKKICDKIILTESEHEYELLEPWIQWQSIHTGLTAKEHGVFRLGDSINSEHRQVFEELESKGLTVGSISAMNSVNNLNFPAYFIPDPWTKTKSDNSFYSKLITKIFIDTVNNNASGKFSKKNYIYLIVIYLKFVRFKKYFLFFKIFFQSISKKWMKALFLDLLIHEIHLNLFKKHKPNFSCVFFNAAAHIQHHYLLNSLANENKAKNPEFILEKNNDPFKDSLEIYDKILFDYLEMDANLIIATGLTQKIVDHSEYYYRLINHDKFLKNIINFNKVYPRMSRDFLITFSNNSERDTAHKILSEIKLNNELFFGDLDLREKSIFSTLTYNKEINHSDKIHFNNKSIKVYDEVVFVAMKNGLHHGKGFLFAKGEIKEKFKTFDTINIKNIKNIILNFFKN